MRFRLRHQTPAARLFEGALFTVGALTMPFSAQSAPSEINTSYTYHSAGTNGAGQLATSDGPRTDVTDITRYSYNTAGYLSTVTNPLGHTVQLSDYNGQGLAEKITDANGVETWMSYHPRGWLLSSTVKHPSGNVSLDAITTYKYDGVGQLTEIISPDGSSLIYEYDGAQRLIAIENNLGERIEYTLDNAGNRLREDIKDNASNITRTQTRVFDELSRLLKGTGANAQSTQYAYDANGNVTQITDGREQTSGQTYDALNRLVSQTDPEAYSSTLGYDNQDRISTVTDHRGLTTTYEYNAFGHLMSQTSPDTGTTTYDYDAAGNRVLMTDANGHETRYTYDALNRLTHIVYAADPGQNVEYVYDDTSDDNYGIGRLTSIIDGSGETHFHYDHLGNVILHTYLVESTLYRVGYQYDAANNITQITYPSGRLVNYTRGVTGRIVGVTTQSNSSAAETTLISAASYRPFGPLAELTFGNGTTQRFDHDQDYRVASIDVSGVAPILRLNYNYDENNNIIAQTNLDTPARGQLFEYDAINRLQRADGGYGTINYDYDPVGNRLAKTITDNASVTAEDYEYASDSNRLLRVDKTVGAATATRQLEYDANGNVIQDQRYNGDVHNLEYDSTNRYSTLRINGTDTAAYLYNALGQRVTKVAVAPLLDEHYHYQLSGLRLADTDSSGQTLREYIYLDERPIAMLTAASTPQQEPTIDFNQYPPSSYGGSQDQSGLIEVQDGGASLYLQGNRWQKIAFPYTVTPNTVIEFDFTSSVRGEIHGLGFDNDNNISSGYSFHLYGSQQWGIRDYQYSGSGTQHFVIPVGQHYTGSMSHLVFFMDHDVSNPTGNSTFSQIRVYEASTDGTAPPTVTITEPSNATPVPYLVGDTVQFSANSQDDNGDSLAADIQWSSSIDGVIGNGPSMSISTLSVGTHTITASVTDQYGQTAEAQVSIVISTTDITVETSADAYVRGGSYASNNYGASTTMVLKNDNSLSYTRWGYLNFNLPPLSPAGPPQRVVLRVYIANTNSDSTRVMGVYQLADSDLSWSETSINWNNRPDSSTEVGSVVVNHSDAGQWIDVDLTNRVNTSSSSGAIGLLLRVNSAPSSKGNFAIGSRESGNAPQLMIQP